MISSLKQKDHNEGAENKYHHNLALLNYAHEFVYDDSDALPLPLVDQEQQ